MQGVIQPTFRSAPVGKHQYNVLLIMQDDDEEGCAVDMNLREKEDEDTTKVHDIKFDEYGIMDDGVDESTNEQLAKLKSGSGK